MPKSLPKRELAKEAEYKYANIVRAVFSDPWLCEAGKLDEIKAFIEFKAGGGVLDTDVVQAAFVPTLGAAAFRGPDEERIDVDGIRYLSLQGVMAPKMNLMMKFSGGQSTAQLTAEVNAALNDDSVKTTLLHVDSPGGIATAVPELGDAIRRHRDSKRFVTYAEGMMASGALWAGTAATESFASSSAKIGSQGAFTVVGNEAQRLKDEGIEVLVIRAGELKAIGNKYEALTAEGIAELQRGINELNDSFVAAMAANRGVSEKYVRENFGRGAMFSAKDAVRRDLIDGVTTFEELLESERARNSSRTSISVPQGNFQIMTITPKVRAAMFAFGCIDSMEATDEVCVSYLRAISKTSGTSLEGAEEDKLIAAITPAGANAVTTQGIDASGNEYTALIADPIDREVLTGEVAATARARSAEITLAGKELNISDTVILAAVTNSELSVADAREEFSKVAADEAGPLQVYGTGTPAIEKVTQGIAATILGRVDRTDMVSSEEREHGRTFRNASFLEMARVSMQANGQTPSGDRNADARAFLANGLQGSGRQNARTLFVGDSVAEPSFNRRGDHPDALSSIMHRMLDGSYDEAASTYQTYTKQAPDVSDTRPRTFLETGVFQELDARGEDEGHDQLKFDSALKAMIMVGKYGNKVALTEEMIIDDDLSIFDSQLDTLQSASVNTVDNSCRTLLVSNPTLMDGTQMFTLTKGNYIDTGNGAPPSAVSASLHRQKHRLIKGFGNTRPMNVAPSSSFHPAEQEDAVRQAFLFNASDPKVAQTDATVNTIRGLLTPVMDAMLDGYVNGTKRWWTFVPKYKPIVVTYLQGKGGSAGHRTTWIDPDTGCRYIAIDLWFGYAPLNWRGSVLNEGQ
jgi:signal peptide peptidase SppA